MANLHTRNTKYAFMMLLTLSAWRVNGLSKAAAADNDYMLDRSDAAAAAAAGAFPWSCKRCKQAFSMSE